jgi:hypothetical protein
VDDPVPQSLLPVLSDLHATCAVRPDIREEAVLMIYGPDGTGMGLRIEGDGDDAWQVADLADQVQEWAVEALWLGGLPAVWPECSEHPDTHPLAPLVKGGVAVWLCPHTGTIVASIGELAGSYR